MFMSAMEATVVATVMPTVVSELHGLELYGWVGAAYLLATAATIPLWGRAADLFGRRPAMITGIAVFVLASAACGAATSLPMLVAARALQGIGAGALQPISLTLVGDLYTFEERARVQGLFGAVWGTAGMAGPFVGGLIAHVASWRWVFFLNVPFGVLCALLLARYLHEPARDTSQPVRIDLPGAALLVTAVVTLLVGIGGRAPALLLPLSIAATAAFVAWERRAPAAILPLSLFSSRLFSAVAVTSALMGAVMTTSLLYLPLYAQALLAASPTEAGAAVAPMLVGWPLASMASARMVPRTGVRPLVRGGLTVVAVAAVALRAVVGVDLDALTVRALMFFMGVGMGLANTAMIQAVQDGVTWELRGIATATSVFARTIGGTVAVGAASALVAWRLADRVPEPVLRALLGPVHGRSLAPGLLARAADDLRDGLAGVFAGVAVLGLAGLAAGWVMPPVALRGSPRDSVTEA